jgi:hypothetical protein
LPSTPVNTNGAQSTLPTIGSGPSSRLGKDKFPFEDGTPSARLDAVEQTTHHADTFYSQVGTDDLLDTDVFPKVGISFFERNLTGIEIA